MSTDPVGPDSEQLYLQEDIDRLSDIADLILIGEASFADFELTKWERAFVDGYLSGGVDDYLSGDIDE